MYTYKHNIIEFTLILTWKMDASNSCLSKVETWLHGCHLWDTELAEQSEPYPVDSMEFISSSLYIHHVALKRKAG